MAKRSLFVLLTVVFLFCASFYVYATDDLLIPANTSNVPVVINNKIGSVTITGGILNAEGSLMESELTFDEKRTIAGLAPNNTSVKLTVFRLDNTGEFNEDGTPITERVDLNVYELVVGQTEMFSLTADLFIGDNNLEITTVSTDARTFRYVCLLTRTPAEIKTDIQNTSVFPWQILQDAFPGLFNIPFAE
ncbi:MAG: hypothetical protein LBS21_00220 [Clostridiales bacterium]|jgi:hypothetical protein|nr:hypothetical protein [Clostridiales bacterium]